MKLSFPQAKFLATAALLGCGFFHPAHAHVGLEWPAAMAGTSYKASFRIGHGCGDSPTRQLIIDIPAGVVGARPMPRPGWSVDIQKGATAQDVARITWTARSPEDMLDAAHFDEFVVLATLPKQPGPIFWPVRQVCLQGRQDWVQVPGPGLRPAEMQFPAPMLDILPAAAAAAHSH